MYTLVRKFFVEKTFHFFCFTFLCLFVPFFGFYSSACLAQSIPTVKNYPQIANGMSAGLEPEIWEMSLKELSMIEVTSVASGTKTPTHKSASVVTVVTRDQIEAMGARDLDEVIETIPGIHVNHSDQAYFPKYVVRGISSRFNPEVLMLMDGVPITGMFLGNRSNVWGAMPVGSIERLEVIRGPGSALYGADAFAGVINIITKSATGTLDNAITVKAGSFETYGTQVEQSHSIGKLALGLSLEYVETNGQEETIEEDAQTLFDAASGTNVSNAPGKLNLTRDITEIHFSAVYLQWQYNMTFQERANVGTGPGIALALDPEGRYRSTRILNDASYHEGFMGGDLDVEFRISYYYNTQEVERNGALFPAGAIIGGFFPEGVIGTPEFKEDQWRLNLSSAYKGIKKHIWRFGMGGFWADIYEVNELKNFDVNFAPRPDGLEDVSDTDEVYLQEKSRQSKYFYLQDEWRVRNDVVLTSGIRLDHYSDFGSTVNPRLGLVWELNPELSSRILYGEAFRAPSFNELYSNSNPVAQGNPNLEPTNIKTTEFTLTHVPTKRFSQGINLYYYEIADVICYVPLTGTTANEAKNIDSQDGYGLEWEAKYDFDSSLAVLGNYSYQKSTEGLSGEKVADAPEYQAYMRVQWEFMDNWRWTTQLLHVGPQTRASNDTRAATASYSKVDITLERKKWMRHLDLNFVIKNLFDEDIRDPSPAPSSPFSRASIPNDFPQAGRWYSLEAKWHWL